jgi:flagellar hook-associated protein 2
MADGIQLAGLASGFDWKAFSDKVIDFERAPARSYEAEKQRNDVARGQLSDLGARLASLQASVNALASSTLGLGRTVSNDSSTSFLKASVSSATPAGTYVVNVESLATSSRLRGVLPSTPLVVSAGDSLSLKVGDSAVETAIPISAGMSIRAIVDAINASGANVTAMSNLSGTEIVLTSRSTGADRDIIVGGTLQSLLGLPVRSVGLDRGSNATFTINGMSFSSSDNVLDKEDHGLVGLSIKAVKTSAAETLVVSADSSSVRGKIDAFVNAYNSVVDFVEKATAISTSGGKTTVGPLASNREVQDWLRDIRASLFSASSVGSVSNLSSLGLDFSGTDQRLTIKNSAQLDAAIAGKSADVISFFNTSGTGLANVIARKLETYVGNDGNTGRLKVSLENYVKANAALDSQINALDRYLQQRRSQLEAGFIAMESAQSKMSQIQGMLNNAFGQNK